MDEVKAVKELGEKIGYGHMMSIASALWKKSLREEGLPTSGAFIATNPDFIEDRFKNEDHFKLYDDKVKDH